MTNLIIVKEGDTLWDISEKHLGSPLQWPRLWRYNNRQAVVLVTGRGIPDPDLIYPGQKLLLPVLPGNHPNPILVEKGMQKRKPKKSLSEQLPDIKSPIVLAYNLDAIAQPPIVLPNAIVEAKLKGSIALSSVEHYPINYVVNKKQLEAQITQQANHAFGELIADTKLAFDNSQNTLTLGSKLISKSTTPNTPATAVGIEVGSNSPIPKLLFEISFPKLKGTINQFHYLAEEVTFLLEVTPRVNGPEYGRDKQVMHRQIPASSNNWDKVFAVGLFATATAVVVATVIEDYFFPPGVADDANCFAFAAGLSARGVVLWNSAQLIVPRATIPAVIRFTTTVVPPATLRYAH